MFSEADKQQILEEAMRPGARLSEVARRYEACAGRYEGPQTDAADVDASNVLADIIANSRALPHRF